MFRKSARAIFSTSVNSGRARSAEADNRPVHSLPLIIRCLRPGRLNTVRDPQQIGGETSGDGRRIRLKRPRSDDALQVRFGATDSVRRPDSRPPPPRRLRDVLMALFPHLHECRGVADETITRSVTHCPLCSMRRFRPASNSKCRWSGCSGTSRRRSFGGYARPAAMFEAICRSRRHGMTDRPPSAEDFFSEPQRRNRCLGNGHLPRGADRVVGIMRT